eukprot:3864849-Prymnesium_polylepis.1
MHLNAKSCAPVHFANPPPLPHTLSPWSVGCASGTSGFRPYIYSCGFGHHAGRVARICAMRIQSVCVSCTAEAKTCLIRSDVCPIELGSNPMPSCISLSVRIGRLSRAPRSLRER